MCYTGLMGHQAAAAAQQALGQCASSSAALLAAQQQPLVDVDAPFDDGDSFAWLDDVIDEEDGDGDGDSLLPTAQAGNSAASESADSRVKMEGEQQAGVAGASSS